MIRLFLIAICAVIVVVVGIVVCNVTTEPEAPAAPDRQHYDLEGGQEMRPRWGRNEGGADGTSGN